MEEAIMTVLTQLNNEMLLMRTENEYLKQQIIDLKKQHDDEILKEEVEEDVPTEDQVL